MFCDEDMPGSQFDAVFDKVEATNTKAFTDIGGEYAIPKNHNNCAIRLPHTVFFTDLPPQQQRFKGKNVPKHVTWAYKKGATIAENKHFYTLPGGKTKKIDILFLIASAPVATASFPEDGSESYVGTAVDMQIAMTELLDMFP